MATISITLTTEAYRRLKKRKQPGESFSDVVLREVPEIWETAGELLSGFERMGVPRLTRSYCRSFAALCEALAVRLRMRAFSESALRKRKQGNDLATIALVDSK